MGCSQSSPHVDNKKPGAAASGGKANGAGSKGKNPMANKDKDARIDSIEATKTATYGGMTVRYAYLSQRGYYPDEPHKANQDSYAVVQSFADRPTDALFGVFDGHGRDGDKCAQFVRDNLPSAMARNVKRMREREAAKANSSNTTTMERQIVAGAMELPRVDCQEACLRSHLECNKLMRTRRDIDDSLSGTTSISAILHGGRNRITVCNVGDSRAIVGRSCGASGNDMEERNGDGSRPSLSSSLKAFALSRDQTPYRRDERVRIRATGARILSLDQVEGLEPIDEFAAENDLKDANQTEKVLGDEIDEGGDPPRVWSPDGDYPGTAFTRSLGDAVAEDLGVIAEPEMLTRDLTPEDKILVLASDGVFEFLTNQSVIDICAKFADPLEACRAVVAESYELWLQYELRTDDITMICIFVDEVDDAVGKAREAMQVSTKFMGVDGPRTTTSGTSTATLSNVQEDCDELMPNDARPVRSQLTLAASRQIEKSRSEGTLLNSDINGNNEDDEALLNDFEIHRIPKTDAEKATIAEAIRASVMFKDVTDSQRELIYEAMEPIPVKTGDWIIKQGTVGDKFYIVDEGRFEVRIGENAVHEYSGSRKSRAHPSFGELALMYSAPRAASIVAQTDGQLWALHRYAFKKVLAGNEKEGVGFAEKSLKGIHAFRTFSDEVISDLASFLVEVKYARGEVIVKEGEVGNSLFIVGAGGMAESVRGGNAFSAARKKLHGGDFFADEILLKNGEYDADGTGDGKCIATVSATTKSMFYRLQKSDVKRVLGSKRKASGESSPRNNMA